MPETAPACEEDWKRFTSAGSRKADRAVYIERGGGGGVAARPPLLLPPPPPLVAVVLELLPVLPVLPLSQIRPETRKSTQSPESLLVLPPLPLEELLPRFDFEVDPVPEDGFEEEPLSNSPDDDSFFTNSLTTLPLPSLLFRVVSPKLPR